MMLRSIAICLLVIYGLLGFLLFNLWMSYWTRCYYITPSCENWYGMIQGLTLLYATLTVLAIGAWMGVRRYIGGGDEKKEEVEKV